MIATQTGTGNGTAPVVNLTFPFIDKSHVRASVGEGEVSFTWTGPTQITFTSAVDSGVAWRVYRQTPTNPPLVAFTNKGGITAAALNKAQDWHRYRDEELADLTTLASLENGRALVVPEGETIAPLTAESQRAGKYPVFDASGNLTVTSSTGGGDAALRGDLAGSNGSALVGFAPAGTFASGSAGYELTKLNTRHLGTAASGSTVATTRDIDFSANPDGTSVVYGDQLHVTVNGSEITSQARASYFGVWLNSLANTVTAMGTHTFVALQNTGTVANVRVIEGHFRIDSSSGGVTGVASIFNVASSTYNATGAFVPSLNGFNAADMGHPTIVGEVRAFTASDQTKGTGNASAYYGGMTAGAGKFNLNMAGDAVNYLQGNTGIGVSAPTEKLDVLGNVNVSGVYKVGGSTVLKARKTGWTQATGTATRTGFDTATATTAQVAQALKALIDDLVSHGLIGT